MLGKGRESLNQSAYSELTLATDADMQQIVAHAANVATHLGRYGGIDQDARFFERQARNDIKERRLWVVRKHVQIAGSLVMSTEVCAPGWEEPNEVRNLYVWDVKLMPPGAGVGMKVVFPAVVKHAESEHAEYVRFSIPNSHPLIGKRLRGLENMGLLYHGQVSMDSRRRRAANGMRPTWRRYAITPSDARDLLDMDPPLGVGQVL